MLGQEAPLVSIVIPFYSTYAPYLRGCLTSIQQQTHQSWEAVVVDDASPTGDAERLVDELDDARIRVIRHTRNRGQAASRNTGIKSTSGPLIMAIDCDDAIAPTHLEKLVAALQADPEVGVAYADFHLFDAVDRDLAFPVRDIQSLLKEQWIPHPGTIVRRTLWNQAQGYCEDETFRAGNEDWEYFLRLAEVGLKAVRVAEPLYQYRQHRSSITNTRFACNDYRTRELMYARHRALFDRCHMRRPFLAGGYFVSGKAFLRRGAFARGVSLLIRSACLSPVDFLIGGTGVLRRGVARSLPRRRPTFARTGKALIGSTEPKPAHRH